MKFGESRDAEMASSAPMAVSINDEASTGPEVSKLESAYKTTHSQSKFNRSSQPLMDSKKLLHSPSF